MNEFIAEQGLGIIPDYFKLVVLVAYRAKEISSGSHAYVPRQGNKSPIVALRELIAGAIDIKELEEGIVKSFQHYVYLEDDEKHQEDSEQP